MITYPIGFFSQPVAGPTWTPADLPGALYWLDASYGISTTGTTGVIEWKDKLADAIFTTTSASYPTYISSDSDFNNYPSVDFPKDGTNVWYLDGPTASYSGQDVFMWQVFLLRTLAGPSPFENMTWSFTTNGSYNGYFNGAGSSSKSEFLFADVNYRNQSSLPAVTGTAIFFFGRGSTGSPNNINDLWDNQESVTSSLSMSTSFLASGTFYVRFGNANPNITGENPGAITYQFNGKFAEGGICFGTVNNTDVADLIDYIKTKYNITPTP